MYIHVCIYMYIYMYMYILHASGDDAAVEVRG